MATVVGRIVTPALVPQPSAVVLIRRLSAQVAAETQLTIAGTGFFSVVLSAGRYTLVNVQTNDELIFNVPDTTGSVDISTIVEVNPGPNFFGASAQMSSF